MSGQVEVIDQVGLGCMRDPVMALAMAVLAAEDREGGVVIAFIDESAMADLNCRYRGVEEPTDVLSFRDADAEDWSDAWPPAAGDHAPLWARWSCVRRWCAAMLSKKALTPAGRWRGRSSTACFTSSAMITRPTTARCG